MVTGYQPNRNVYGRRVDVAVNSTPHQVDSSKASEEMTLKNWMGALVPGALLAGRVAVSLAQTVNAADSATITNHKNTWTLQNDVLRSVVVFSNGSVEMTSFYNKPAQRDYLTGSGERHLFQYTYDGTEFAVFQTRTPATPHVSQ